MERGFQGKCIPVAHTPGVFQRQAGRHTAFALHLSLRTVLALCFHPPLSWHAVDVDFRLSCLTARLCYDWAKTSRPAVAVPATERCTDGFRSHACPSFQVANCRASELRGAVRMCWKDLGEFCAAHLFSQTPLNAILSVVPECARRRHLPRSACALRMAESLMDSPRRGTVHNRRALIFPDGSSVSAQQFISSIAGTVESFADGVSAIYIVREQTPRKQMSDKVRQSFACSWLVKEATGNR